jgi:hypothetical protein
MDGTKLVVGIIALVVGIGGVYWVFDQCDIQYNLPPETPKDIVKIVEQSSKVGCMFSEPLYVIINLIASGSLLTGIGMVWRGIVD